MLQFQAMVLGLGGGGKAKWQLVPGKPVTKALRSHLYRTARIFIFSIYTVPRELTSCKTSVQ